MEGPLSVEDRWRDWVNTHPIAGMALAGLVAVQMATICGYYFIGVGLPSIPWPLYNGALGAPLEKFGSASNFFVGQSIHMVDGVIFAILFAVLAHRKLPFSNNTMGDLLKGLVYGTILAIISMGFLVPYVYAPKSGFGFFSFYTADHWKLPLGILIWHWIYGGFLGLLYTSSRTPAKT